MASKRARNFRLCSRSASIAFCEKSSSLSFQRLSPSMEAKIGLVRSVYSQRSASRSFSAFLRFSRSVCGGAAKALELSRDVSKANRARDRMIRNLRLDLKNSNHYKLVSPAPNGANQFHQRSPQNLDAFKAHQHRSCEKLLCLSKTSKCLSGRELYWFHNSLLRC